MADSPVCPCCGQPTTTAEMAAYRRCESCYAGVIPGILTKWGPRLADKLRKRRQTPTDERYPMTRL